jgi:hypothetical protein
VLTAWFTIRVMLGTNIRFRINFMALHPLVKIVIGGKVDDERHPGDRCCARNQWAIIELSISGFLQSTPTQAQLASVIRWAGCLKICEKYSLHIGAVLS